MPDYPPSAYAEIDLNALCDNYRRLCRQARPGQALLAVVKADAYGHGAVPVSRALAAAGAPLFAVASVHEGALLRAAGVAEPILVMGRVAPGEESQLFTQRLTPYLFDLDSAERFQSAACAAGERLAYHLKVDTGMGRIGFAPDDLPAVLPALRRLDRLDLDGVMTHCARADEPGAALTAQQVGLFSAVLQQVEAVGFNPTWRHLANSAALLGDVAPECNLARPGIALYGGESLPSSSDGLRPVMSLRAPVVQLKTVPAGTGLSYGHTCVTNRATRVAVVAIGYADGYNRLLSSQGEGLLCGRRIPVLGRVCMDWTLFDVTDLPQVQVGDHITLLGSDGFGNVLPAEEWAKKVGSISYEVFCNIGQRVPRIYKN
jgi:alanine racemase